jgi:hypothetical protein
VDVHFNEPGRAFISDLEVAQAHRQHGLGTMLVKAALDSARRQGSTATELEANPGPGSISKQALVSMYQKMGFRNEGFTQRGNPRMSTESALQRKFAYPQNHNQTIQQSKKQRDIRANKIYSGQHGGMWYPSGSSGASDKIWSENGITAHELYSGPGSTPKTKEGIEGYWVKHPTITRSQLAARFELTTEELDKLGVRA